MDLTQGSEKEKQARAKKMMLWFGIVSLIMSFAGWTSAFVVSSAREDWLTGFVLPNAFSVSVALIILSSLTLLLAKKYLKLNMASKASFYLGATMLLGIGFIVSQLIGFQQIIDLGFNFTGPTSNITMSYIYIIAAVHILHVIVGLICLMVVIYNHFKQKYNTENLLGFELAANFWHFVDILWLYLFLFLVFMS
ncbi:cytochrome c oxidase subunit 3 [Flavobacteriaceae bacterium]|jgi:cytochrome c oxidase subunit III|nr:cytochrome c oxidase subunit 3 [Flavobacteriaceae bacterium]MDC0956863.1 cytochrome c oxidase subunit 3 [Flavobacteriaceae bacterium]MDC3269522.1 cytochrome c oxidase subunit 3 [Flavobacteriaceae bacterium]MDC3326768.1 cytochrome c oxidase subunit 3 [Flavobacteriaceae bacterium]|tara:strand:+ start:12389 stop:12970 length:582 start_codon:yes stop_codon:yes gene_type:complete